MKRINIKEEYGNYLKILRKLDLVPDSIRVGNPKGAPIPLRGSIKTTYSDRMLIIGDAAGFVSPIGGDGLYYGMSSGKIASDTVEYALEKDATGKDTMLRYQEEWTRKWGKDLNALCYFADKMFARADQIINYARRDEVLRRMCVGLYNGECKASRMKTKLYLHMAKDKLLYDILKPEK
jgi:flavin-dependent dehydrogenase